MVSRSSTIRDRSADSLMIMSSSSGAVSDSLNARIQVFDTFGDYRGVLGQRGLYVGNLTRPKGIALDSDGNVYVSESYFDHVIVYNQGGDVLMALGGSGIDPGQFSQPTGLWIDERDRALDADPQALGLRAEHGAFDVDELELLQARLQERPGLGLPLVVGALAAGAQEDVSPVGPDGFKPLEVGPTTEVLEFYKAITEASPPGELFWKQSRELYFAGKAAMIIWSPFILDELAGLRDAAPPTINDDPTTRELAAVTSVVTSFAGPSNPGGAAWSWRMPMPSWPSRR